MFLLKFLPTIRVLINEHEVEVTPGHLYVDLPLIGQWYIDRDGIVGRDIPPYM